MSVAPRPVGSPPPRRRVPWAGAPTLLRRGGWPVPRGEPPLPSSGALLAAALAAAPYAPAPTIMETLQPDVIPEGPMRLVEVAALLPDGQLTESTQMVPVHPAYDAALLAFSRATVVQSRRGLVAVEDLRPGEEVLCLGGFRPLLWRAATLLLPGESLTRVTEGALGLHRPEADLWLGPAARVGQRAVAELTDGEGIVAVTPRKAAPMLHLGFAHPERVHVGGVEVEAFHPATLESEIEPRGAHWRGLLPHLIA